MNRATCPRLLLLCFLHALTIRAAELPESAKITIDFVKHIQPIFKESCLSCHGPEKRKGGLRLDVKASALQADPQVILPGRSHESRLILLVASLDADTKMPPKGAALTREQIALLRAWIDQGATWPESASAVVDNPAKSHWSFQPLRRPDIPESPRTSTLNGIDLFIAAGLSKSGLMMSPEAGKRTLVRRLYLTLHGLPPTPEEADAFVNNTSPTAYEDLVDRLLDSPRYGERWARHWLDVVAFGETDGFEVNTPRENAWPYRDYVIDALNRDVPYPRFILDQLAGDTTGEDRATGYLVSSAALLPGQIGKDKESMLKARSDELNEIVAKVGGAFLGLTLHCARCHDHKFDPVAQADYHAIQAVFAGVKYGEREIRPLDWEERQKLLPVMREQKKALATQLFDYEPLASLSESSTPRAPIHSRLNVDRFAPVRASKLRFTVQTTTFENRLAPCIDELEIYTTGPERQNVALASAGAKVSASGSINTSIHKLEHINDGRYGNERSWISDKEGYGQVVIEFARPETVDAVVWSRDRNEKYRDRLAQKYTIETADEAGTWTLVATSDDRKAWPGEQAPQEPIAVERLNPEAKALYFSRREELARIEAKVRDLGTMPKIFAGRFEQPQATFRFHRGDPMQTREQVSPGAVASVGPKLKLDPNTPERERRVALAKWIADPENPLPARVLVNRLWLQHFGEGLVSTPSDFGRNGTRPSHPELLDWLASEFIARGWSIKAIQRLIVNSAAWRQTSEPTPAGLKVDAACRLLWRFPPRRLDAEIIRDSMLANAGSLDLRMGGPGFSVFAPNSNYVRVYDPKTEYGASDWRRMIYMTKVRMAQDSTFGAFDCPDAGQMQPKRPRSTTAIQALSLFNSQFVNQQSAIFAERLQREAGKEDTACVRRAYALALGRDPENEESIQCSEFVRFHGLPAFCRVLLNTNEFLFMP